MEQLNLKAFSQLVIRNQPYAAAMLRGNADNPQISGTVLFYPAAEGTLITAEVFGLPRQVGEGGETKEAGPFYAFHVHEGGHCGSADGPGPFDASGMHYNPTRQPHPMHAGDLPPLLADAGYAYLSTYTGRFTPEQIVGRTVIVHAHPDDFKTQPGGGAGQKLACGEIKAY